MKQSRTITIICRTCGQPFAIPKSRQKTAHFCSIACHNLSQCGETRHHILPHEEIIQRYQSGETGQQIAFDYGVSKEAIYYHLNRAGIPRRQSRGWYDLSDEIRERICAINRANTKEKHHGYIAVDVEHLIKRYKEGATLQEISAELGIATPTVARRLKDAGITIRPAGFGVWRICSDGHKVQSRWEQAVDEWLYAHKLSHEIHPCTPWDKKQHADFLVNDKYIEVWGISDNDAYERRKADKKRQYIEAGVTLVEIVPRHVLEADFSPLEIAFLHD